MTSCCWGALGATLQIPRRPTFFRGKGGVRRARWAVGAAQSSTGRDFETPRGAVGPVAPALWRPPSAAAKEGLGPVLSGKSTSSCGATSQIAERLQPPSFDGTAQVRSSIIPDRARVRSDAVRPGPCRRCRSQCATMALCPKAPSGSFARGRPAFLALNPKVDIASLIANVLAHLCVARTAAVETPLC